MPRALATLTFLATVTACLVVSGCNGDEEGIPDPCRGVDCSGHGTCVVEGNTAVCHCEEHYQPVGLECVPGEGDADVDADAVGDADVEAEPEADTVGDADVEEEPEADAAGDADVEGEPDAEGDIDTDAPGDADEEVCVPDCTGRECGPDPLCGLECGPCPATATCVVDTCALVLPFVVIGEGYRWWTGASVSSAGDVNADGFPDIIVGSNGATVSSLSRAGTARVFSGRTGELLWQFDGSEANDAMGTSVSGAGDVDNDGYDDLIVGASSADPGDVSNAGSAYVFAGDDGSLLYRFDGESENGYLGAAVSGAGDVNDDDHDDLLVGAWNTGVGGVAYVFSGVDGSLLHQFDGSVGEGYGDALAAAGDVDGDGHPDLLIGVSWGDRGASNGGYAVLISGATWAPLWYFDGQAAMDNCGEAVGVVGDVNDDDVTDFVIGAAHADPGGLSNAGSAYVVSGSTGALLHRFDGSSESETFGWDVAGAGDFDGDETPDILVGARLADPSGVSQAGSAFVYSGSDWSELARFDGTAPDDYLGSAVAGAGDLNGDGHAEVIIGASGSDETIATDAGRATVFPGLP